MTGIIQPSPEFENNDDLTICPAVTTTRNIKCTVLINIFLEHPYTLKKGCHIATFSISNPQQTKYIKPVNPASGRHFLDTNYDAAIQYVHALLQIPKSIDTNETYWFPTPEEPGGEAQHTPIQKRLLQEIIALQKLEQLNPQNNQESRKQFLSKFDGTDSKLHMAVRKSIEE